MELPTSPKRCLAIVMLRVVGLKQKGAASIAKCANQIVVDVEKWFKKEDYHRVARICDDQSIKKMVAAEAIYWGLEEETLVKLDRLTQDDILRHYRTDYIERRDPMLQKYLMEWREQLNHPPPELIFLGSLGRIGEDNSIALKQDILNIALEDLRFSVRVTQTTLHPDYASTAGRVFWKLLLDGSVQLLCPVERQPHFQELLASLTEDGRRTFSNWKFVGGKYLVACMRAWKPIQDQAEARAGGLVVVHSRIGRNLGLPRPPSHLNAEFGNLIYQLSIKCRRSPSILQLIEGLYDISQPGFFCELTFGLGEPLATGLRGEVEYWIDLHRSMIKESAQSKVTSQLIEMDERLRTPEKVVKAELNKIIDKGGLD